jgi:hypothetical protein
VTWTDGFRTTGKRVWFELRDEANDVNDANGQAVSAAGGL